MLFNCEINEPSGHLMWEPRQAKFWRPLSSLCILEKPVQIKKTLITFKLTKMKACALSFQTLNRPSNDGTGNIENKLLFFLQFVYGLIFKIFIFTPRKNSYKKYCHKINSHKICDRVFILRPF